ncbi:MAG: hypothetical protein GWN73_31950, partial [Actinobacteria bacterium]|nr:hypothetical protein [Actinomycetota bacterium]
MFLTLAFVAISFGGAFTAALIDDPGAIWVGVRLVGGALVLVVGIALLFKAAPNRRQPAVSWLAAG